MNRKRHPGIRNVIGTALLLAGIAAGSPADLWAQSNQPSAADRAPAAPDDPNPAKTPKATETDREEKGPPERNRSYRQEKDPQNNFVPSEEIRVDKAVDFPADI
jgi:hypothetical protein